MKFHIGLLKNKAIITNKNEIAIKGLFPVDILPNEQYETTIGLAKTRLGNWDKENDFEEITRRKNLGIFDFELIIEEIVEEKTQKGEKGPVFEEETEAEFEELEDLVKNNKKTEETPDKCHAKTKSGKACKGKPLENGFCLAHQKVKGE